ncbi:hypothetical protein [Streptomyces physcomitrii]|uniref:Uncharacterized protein n=1 Tax=Streptomyces physcomitrii TaxID=2724184 RepID=A0ABX1H875_9ACTN|nr:hypothetical protein [Streptomyces physcomitrii]NKI43216.1 hypothetical protein [Streptomyces physcomitrii]
MSSASLNPTVLAPRPVAPSGATAAAGTRPHRLGGALRAVRAFTGAAFGVLVLGEYEEEAAGVRRR